LFYNLFWVIIKTYQGEQVQEADGGRRGYLKSESTRKARRSGKKKKPIEKTALEKEAEKLLAKNAEMLKKSMAGVLA